jgi:FdhD protein
LRQHADSSIAGALVLPDPGDPRLTRKVAGLDHDGKPVKAGVVVERPLTLLLNSLEIVTMMTIGDYPEYLAVGYLLNQDMLRPDGEITGIDSDEELGVVVVRTVQTTDYEDKLAKKVLTSGCAQDNVCGDVTDKFERPSSTPRRACTRAGCTSC